MAQPGERRQFVAADISRGEGGLAIAASTPTPHLRIISATRHEADNVGPLTKRLYDSLSDADFSWDLLFVDDSDDHTPERIRELVDLGFPVRMLHRPPLLREGGLSSALNIGFATSLADLVLVIDGDLQHPPEVVPSVLEPLLSGDADVVVASRYIPGGSSTGLAGSFRPLVSRGATLTVQAMFPQLRAIKDPVSGFFAFRSDVIRNVELRPEGFKMLVELLVRGNWTRCVEVPFHFAGRTSGVSNLTLSEGMHFLNHMARLWKDTTGPAFLRRFGSSNPPHLSGSMQTETGEWIEPTLQP